MPGHITDPVVDRERHRARIHFPGPGGAHEPTALALVVDNSLSSTLIEDGDRRLEALKAVARESAQGSGPGDAIWVIEAGSPWSTSSPGGGPEALARIDETQPSHGSGDLGAALRRALALVNQSDLPAREIHLFTDLQATGFPAATIEAEDTPIVVFGLGDPPTPNRGISSVTIGGGLPPLANRRSEAVVELLGTQTDDTVGVRVYVDGQVRAATQAPVGATVRLPIGPFPPGRVEGWAEVDPDPLTADDRHFFTFVVRDPTAVASLGDAPFFVAQALAVLQDDGRIVVGAASRAQTILSAGGAGLDTRDRSQSAIVYPLGDPTRLPALNRALAEAGIPFSYELARLPQARVATTELDIDLGDLQISSYFRLVRAGNQDAAAVATLSNGDAWIVDGETPSGSYVLLASPLDNQSTTLPVSASMIPLLEWAVDRWSAVGGATGIAAGSPYTPPATSTHVQTPGGDRLAVDGDQPFYATRETGMYHALDGETVLDAVAANAPPAEGDLARLTGSELRAVVPGVTRIVDEPSEWTGSIFRAGRGPEPWRPLLILVLTLLAVESAVAASGRMRARSSATTPRG